VSGGRARIARVQQHDGLHVRGDHTAVMRRTHDERMPERGHQQVVEEAKREHGHAQAREYTPISPCHHPDHARSPYHAAPDRSEHTILLPSIVYGGNSAATITRAWRTVLVRWHAELRRSRAGGITEIGGSLSSHLYPHRGSAP